MAAASPGARPAASCRPRASTQANWARYSVLLLGAITRNRYNDTNTRATLAATALTGAMVRDRSSQVHARPSASNSQKRPITTSPRVAKSAPSPQYSKHPSGIGAAITAMRRTAGTRASTVKPIRIG